MTRRDRTAAALTWWLGLGTLLVAAWIPYRSVDAVLDALAHPARLTVAQANLAGLLSLDLMLLATIGLARLPWLERAWGRERLTRGHRRLGWWSLWLMGAHVWLLALQRVLREPFAIGGALADVFWHEPWMAWASVGTALLVVVALTSTRVVRRMLRHERWHLLHLWSYAGMGLVLPHVLIGADFPGGLGDGWVEPWWWGLYAATLLAVLGFRVALPAVRSARSRLRVARVVPHGDAHPGGRPGAVSVEVTGRRLDRVGARPGQFLVWRFLGSQGASRGRSHGHPYSLSAAPTDTAWRVTVAGTGDGARRAAGLEEGSRVLVEGPYGSPVTWHRRHSHLVLLAAGAGITPYRALLEDEELLADEGLPDGGVTLVHRVGDAGDRLLGDEVDALAAARGFRVVVLAGARRSPGSWLPAGVDGTEGEAMRRLVPELSDADVAVCGPPRWADAVVAAARAAGVRRRDLHREDFSW